MRKIAVFYHGLFAIGNPPELILNAFEIVDEQMQLLQKSGLLSQVSHFVVGINGGDESLDYANLIVPNKAKKILHGLSSRSENLTIVEIEKWVKDNPGWNVLYIHAKGATHKDPEYIIQGRQWRNCMMRNLVLGWTRCVQDLNLGFDSVGCHWLTKMGSDHSQNYWGGNFWWARSEFLQTLPSIKDRARIKLSGLSSLESRFEAEVWIGNGPRLPKVRDYHPVNPSIRNACVKQF